MKLHHLRLRGIGPFRSELSIDFAALGVGGLFLIEGPTGSGKSTILDSLVYALYGTVAGADASGDRIRSQFADPEEASVVDLVFETSSGIYRVRREPERQRPKRRGTGTIKENAKALLWRVASAEMIPTLLSDGAADGAAADSGLEPLATRLDEVGREITRAVGLSHAQFTQTVLLPQGEFARFLRARTGDRQQVLQRVFGTELYERIEKRLEEMRREASAQVEEARSGLGRAVARFIEASALGEDEPSRSSLEDHAESLRFEDLGAVAAAVVARAEEDARAPAETARRRRSESAAAREAREAAGTVLQRIERRRQLDGLAAGIRSRASEVETARSRREADERARPIAAAIARRDASRSLALAAQGEFAALRSACGELHPQLAEMADAHDAGSLLQDHLDASRTRAGELSAMVDLEKAIPQRQTELEQRTAQLEQQQSDLDALVERIATRPAAREQLVKQRDAAREAATGLEDSRLQVQAAEQRLEHSRRAQSLLAAALTARTAAATAQTASRKAAETEAELRRRRNAGLAAELAEGLEEGSGCPVCGSLEHPAPAAPGEDHVEAEALEAAEESRRLAEEKAAAAKQTHALAVADHERALELAAGLGVEEAEADRSRVAEVLTRVRERSAEAKTLEKRLEEHDEQDRRLSAQRESLALALESGSASLREAVTTLAGDRRRLEDSRGGHESVAAHRAAHLALARDARRLREALLAAELAASRAAELEKEVLLGDFAEEEVVLRAVLEDAERDAIDALVQRDATDRARLAEGLAEAGIAEVDAGEDSRAAAVMAVDTATAAVASAEEAASRADAESGRRAAIAEAGSVARARLADGVDRVRSVSEEAAAVVRVADLATGRSADGDRIQLSTYVLMRRFEEVLAAANTRLALFSGSDLELERDEGARGARKTGLDLRVIDRRTDASRVPETLSGGETFLVSLALALGLADIVTAEAGGIQLETLFIDEGFGSLDPESLDRVIAEIGQLAAGGRSIGLVSHVGDMKQQITEQIRVRRRPDGSSGVTVIA